MTAPSYTQILPLIANRLGSPIHYVASGPHTSNIQSSAGFDHPNNDTLPHNRTPSLSDLVPALKYTFKYHANQLKSS